MCVFACVGACIRVCMHVRMLSILYCHSVLQVLLTKSDLNESHSRSLLKETMNNLLAMNVIPILNANDTVSEPYAPEAGDYVSAVYRIYVRILCIYYVVLGIITTVNLCNNSEKSWPISKPCKSEIGWNSSAVGDSSKAKFK